MFLLHVSDGTDDLRGSDRRIRPRHATAWSSLASGYGSGGGEGLPPGMRGGLTLTRFDQLAQTREISVWRLEVSEVEQPVLRLLRRAGEAALLAKQQTEMSRSGFECQ